MLLLEKLENVLISLNGIMNLNGYHSVWSKPLESYAKTLMSMIIKEVEVLHMQQESIVKVELKLKLLQHKRLKLNVLPFVSMSLLTSSHYQLMLELLVTVNASLEHVLPQELLLLSMYIQLKTSVTGLHQH
jgi:hypothetical protein